LKIAIIIGSTRPGRRGEAIAHWAHKLAAERTDAQFELIDLAEYKLPLLDEPTPPSRKSYTKAHTHAWSEKIASYDGFVFVTPEYNHSISGALKNAIDFLHHEWNNKAAGFVSYGGAASGARAVEHLRLILAELQVATVRAQVGMGVLTDFENYTAFKPLPQRADELKTMLNQLVSWTAALRTVRHPAEKPAHAAG
jgi:NAD(P)H-dependent FMN reductase